MDGDEKILWRGIPKKSCYVLQNSSSQIPAFVAILWGVIDISILFSILATAKLTKNLLFFMIPFFLLHLTPTWIWIAGLFKTAKKVFRIEYVITNKRIIKFDGKPKFMVFSLDFDDIIGVKYKQSFVDKIFHVADIYVSSEKNKFVLFDIPNGLFIYEKLDKIVKDVDREKKNKKLFYNSNIECKHCGSFYDSNFGRCPNCGAPKSLND